MAAKKKKVVRKKSAAPALDDQQLLRAQKKKAREMKAKQKQKEEAERKAQEEAALAAAEAAKAEEEERRRTKRRKKAAAKKRAEEDALEAQKREIEEQKRALEEERRRLEIEAERAALEAERAKLEAERAKLAEAPKKAKKKPKKQAEELPEIDPSDLDDILAMAREEEEDDFSDMPPAKPVASKKPVPKKAAAPKPKAKASARKKKSEAPVAVAVAEEVAEEVELVVTEEEKPESVKDWVDDIKGGADWNRVGVRYGVPIGLLVVLFFYFGTAFGYGLVELPKMRAIASINEDPKPDPGLPAKPPSVRSDQVWLPIGPLRVLVPAEGPVAIDWSRPQQAIEYIETITLHFRGWSLVVGRYKKDSVIKALDGKVSDSFVEQYVAQGSDKALIDEVMTTVPDHFEWFSSRSWVNVFKTKLNLKQDLFPELERGVRKVSYGSATGYFFGEPGSPKPQRVEVFDSSGFRFSYHFKPGKFHRSMRKLMYAQQTDRPHVAAAKEGFRTAYDNFEGKSPEPFRELLRAAMYAAGLSIGEDLGASDINNVRSALLASDFSKLSSPRDADADAAFDVLYGTGSKNNPEVRRVMLGLYAHSSKKLRERAKRYFERMSGITLSPGETGWDTAERWVEAEEEREARDG